MLHLLMSSSTLKRDMVMRDTVTRIWVNCCSSPVFSDPNHWLSPCCSDDSTPTLPTDSEYMTFYSQPDITMLQFMIFRIFPGRYRVDVRLATPGGHFWEIQSRRTDEVTWQPPWQPLWSYRFNIQPLLMLHKLIKVDSLWIIRVGTECQSGELFSYLWAVAIGNQMEFNSHWHCTQIIQSIGNYSSNKGDEHHAIRRILAYPRLEHFGDECGS